MCHIPNLQVKMRQSLQPEFTMLQFEQKHSTFSGEYFLHLLSQMLELQEMGGHLSILLTILYSSGLEEERILAGKIQRELNTTIKSFVRRADDNHGKALQKYLRDIKTKSSVTCKKTSQGKKNCRHLGRLG